MFKKPNLAKSSFWIIATRKLFFIEFILRKKQKKKNEKLSSSVM
jgi:hypothetical protein